MRGEGKERKAGKEDESEKTLSSKMMFGAAVKQRKQEKSGKRSGKRGGKARNGRKAGNAGEEGKVGTAEKRD